MQLRIMNKEKVNYKQQKKKQILLYPDYHMEYYLSKKTYNKQMKLNAH